MADSFKAKSQSKGLSYTRDELFEYFDSDKIHILDSFRLANTPANVVGSFLERLKSTDDQRTVLRKLDEIEVSEIISEMDPDDAAEVISEMREQRAVKIIEELDPDDAADLVNELDEVDRERLLEKVDSDTADIVRTLITYDPDTAGGIMTPEVATVLATSTTAQAIEGIRTISEEIETIYYIYVVDKTRHLQGVVSMRDILLASPQTLISQIMTTELEGVCQVDMDQEEAALLMADSNLQALPVVDTDNTLLGIITHDDVIEIIQEEATEDLQKMVGAGADENIHDTIASSVRGRSPWLLVNLVTALGAGGVIMFFEESIQELTILAVFLPIIANLGGNCGAQTLAVIIRGLALGDITFKDSKDICIKEGAKGLINGLIIGLASAVIAGVFKNDFMIAQVVFYSMLMTMTYACVAGAFIPLLLRKLNLDPAQSSSIFLTATTDIVGFAIFLGLASAMLF